VELETKNITGGRERGGGGGGAGAVKIRGESKPTSDCFPFGQGWGQTRTGKKKKVPSSKICKLSVRGKGHSGCKYQKKKLWEEEISEVPPGG